MKQHILYDNYIVSSRSDYTGTSYITILDSDVFLTGWNTIPAISRYVRFMRSRILELIQ